MNAMQQCPPDESTLMIWTRRLLACNPFYLVSAACLLYGLYCLTLDPAFREGAISQLATIFGSLQLYEILLVATAIFLASRRIWYDATLLVTLENLLVLVSFLLVTLAAFQGPVIAWLVCGSGVVFAAAKFWSLKRFFRELNLPLALLGIGGLILAANLFVPFYFKAVHRLEDGSLLKYSGQSWLFGLPLLLGLVNLLKRPTHWPEVAAERSWLPLLTMAIWIAVSAVHLWCIDYIYDLPWQAARLAPLVWVTAWTTHRRMRDFTPIPSPGLRSVLHALPAAAVYLGLADGQAPLVLALAAFNAAAYGIAYVRRDGREAYHLLLISLATVVAALPDRLGEMLFADYHRAQWVLAAVIGYGIGRAMLSSQPIAGVGGAIATAFSVNYLFSRLPDAGQLTIAAYLVFVLIHSLCWRDQDYAYAAALRWAAAGAWVLQTAFWVLNAGATVGWTVVGLAGLVLLSYGVTYLIDRRWASKVIPGAALMVLFLPPGKMIAGATPAGLLAIGLAFVLCGIGTFFALRQDRWNSQRRDEV